MKIALVPMAAKPYHVGHHYLIETASLENDKVIVFASTSDRVRQGEFPVSGKSMEKIWREEISHILPENVDVVYGGSPVRKVYEVIGEACEDPANENVYTVYSDVVDTKKNYPTENREKYMLQLYATDRVRFAAEDAPEKYIRGAENGAPDASATNIRRALSEGDFVKFSRYMPAGLNSYVCWNYLCG